MTRAVLTLNAGSSSLKFALFGVAGDAPLASGIADRIGPEGTLKMRDGAGGALAAMGSLASPADALRTVLAGLDAALPGLQVAAVGHRVVHGGPDRAAPAVVDAALMVELQGLAPLAPLHQPHNLSGIRAAMAAFPDAPQVACFDTAFHRGHPWVNDTYGLPREFHDQGVRRYGFHGLSYDYVAGEMARIDPALAEGRVIIAHLGNGGSACGLIGGRSVASTMGFSTLDGLAMGTRPGQIDPGAILYLIDHLGMTTAQVSDLLYKKSGLLGLSGLSNDMRSLLASDAPQAAQAIAYFTHRLRHEIGAMAATLGGLDALVFCGGIGENAAPIRAMVCEPMGWMGITLDAARNAANGPVISVEGAPVAVRVIATNEELVIARATRRLGLGLGGTA